MSANNYTFRSHIQTITYSTTRSPMLHCGAIYMNSDTCNNLCWSINQHQSTLSPCDVSMKPGDVTAWRPWYMTFWVLLQWKDCCTERRMTSDGVAALLICSPLRHSTLAPTWVLAAPPRRSHGPDGVCVENYWFAKPGHLSQSPRAPRSLKACNCTVRCCQWTSECSGDPTTLP
jgi:hypothetical protein